MESLSKIMFNRNKQTESASLFYLILSKKIVRSITILTIWVNFFTLLLKYLLALLEYNYFLIDLMSRFSPIILLIGFIYFIFIHFLSSFENKLEIPDNQETYDILKYLDFESIKIMSSVGTSNIDISLLFNNIFRTRIIGFVAKELELNTNQIDIIVKGMPQSLTGSQLACLIFDEALKIAISSKSKIITSADIFWGFIKTSKNFNEFLSTLELEEKDIKNVIYFADVCFLDNKKGLTEKIKVRKPGIAEDWASGYTLNLNRFSSDISSSGSNNSESLGGRDDLISEMESVLTKGSKNNCIIVGPTGVGKSTLVRVLAKKIYWGESVDSLNHKRVVKIDSGALISASKNSAELEYLIRSVFSDAITAGNIILFIDDIHVLFSGGSKKGTIDASEIIMPFLESSELKIIGVTTDEYYETYISSKTNISGNFEKIEMEPTDETETMKILADVSMYYSFKYKVPIAYSGLKTLYTFSESLNNDKELPAKAIDLLEETCSYARNSKVKALDKRTISPILEKITKLPVAEAGESEKVLLKDIDNKISTKVIGQKEAVRAVSDALKIARTGADSTRKKPIGSFLFLGPTGVGKTELTKALAWAYFGNEDSMVRMDMSEYQSPGSIERFTGKKISGKEELEGGDFAKKIRNNPFSVVLLDELEKAEPKILDLFLQILDEGYFTDGMGKKINMKNTIIIATSNAGANVIREKLISGVEISGLKEDVLEYIQKNNIYRPEFINRFDGVILFSPLSKNDITEIAKLTLNNLLKSYQDKGYLISIEEGALSKMAEEGYNPEYGARPMNRVFKDRFEKHIADLILNDKINKGEMYNVTQVELYNEV